MEDDYTTNSHYLTSTFLFERLKRMHFFSLDVLGVRPEWDNQYRKSLPPKSLSLPLIFNLQYSNFVLPRAFKSHFSEHLYWTFTDKLSASSVYSGVRA